MVVFPHGIEGVFSQNAKCFHEEETGRRKGLAVAVKDHKYLVLRWDGDDMTSNGKLADVMYKPGTNI